MQQDVYVALVQRLGRRYTEQRLRIEANHEAEVLGERISFFNLKDQALSEWLIRNALRLVGLYRRGLKNAARVELKRNHIPCMRLPSAFDGLTILHITDMHIDLNPRAMQSMIQLVEAIDYDICVLTGDYPGKPGRPFDAAIEGLKSVRRHLRDPIYGVLGNYDSIRMVPELEALGIRMLLNECDTLSRGNHRIHLAGIDDAHFFRTNSIEKASAQIQDNEFSILLSHTPEIYRQASAADFDLLLAGHTHGGQICLPLSIPITLDSVLPRRMGSGPWEYRGMIGYTSAGVGSSIVPVRFNCAPSITLHTLCCAPHSPSTPPSKSSRRQKAATLGR